MPFFLKQLEYTLLKLVYFYLLHCKNFVGQTPSLVAHKSVLLELILSIFEAGVKICLLRNNILLSH